MSPRKKPTPYQKARAAALRILAHSAEEDSAAALARGEKRTAYILLLQARSYRDRAEMYEKGIGK